MGHACAFAVDDTQRFFLADKATFETIGIALHGHEWGLEFVRRIGKKIAHALVFAIEQTNGGSAAEIKYGGNPRKNQRHDERC